VIGVGLNVAIPDEDFPAELRGTAASLGEGIETPDALTALNERLASWVDAEPAVVLAEFRRRDALRGRQLSWDGGAGTAAGIDDDGHLLVETAPGERIALGAGEVQLDPVYSEPPKGS
jgi:BirA family biotin operon repressor/biotin-[acetyl-CoA-carboxylase] ligase